jgi:hypothetical protein
MLWFALSAALLAVGAADRVPKEFDCGARFLAMDYASSLLGENSLDVADALRLQECKNYLSSDLRSSSPALENSNNESTVSDVTLYVDATKGKDSNDGSLDNPLLTLEAARDRIRASRQASSASQSKNSTVFLRGGMYHLSRAFVLTDDDGFVRYAAYRKEPVVISGGVAMDLEFNPVTSVEAQHLKRAMSAGASVLVATVPASVNATNQSSMFQLRHHGGSSSSSAGVVDHTRLTWAREPNGDAEVDLQPDGYALVTGGVGGPGPSCFPPTGNKGALFEVQKTPARNSSVYPYHGLDFDFREPANPARGVLGGWQWLHAGGDADRFANGRNFWNGTAPAGVTWNSTGDTLCLKFFTAQHLASPRITSHHLASPRSTSQHLPCSPPVHPLCFRRHNQSWLQCQWVQCLGLGEGSSWTRKGRGSRFPPSVLGQLAVCH